MEKRVDPEMAGFGMGGDGEEVVLLGLILVMVVLLLILLKQILFQCLRNFFLLWTEGVTWEV